LPIALPPRSTADNSRPSGRRRLLATGVATLAGGLTLASRPARAQAQGLGDVPSVVAAAKPSVFAVGVYSRIQQPPFRFAGTGFSLGGGLFATCAHVVQTLNPATREMLALAVATSEGHRVIEVRPVAVHRESDLAVLEWVEAPPITVRGLRLASTTPAEGSDIVLIGFPIGSALGLYAAAHRGVVAAVVPMAIPMPSSAGLQARNVQALRGTPIEVLQLDATAFPGNSGGPVIDVRTGLVVGVVSMALVKGTRESALSTPTGISYAVPVQPLAALLPGR
jgi:S1-C subfamily serine protease